ncbi:hypothetical protein B484DRAFT_402220 [Ochromonadaceae sp. CCMP2298]|nr:hypothetical protein B484DRAFT_402220 [Ochromonadaceae sp. CCMP2298]
MQTQAILLLLVALVTLSAAFRVPMGLRSTALRMSSTHPSPVNPTVNEDYNDSGVGSGGAEEGGFYSVGKKSFIHSIDTPYVVNLPDMRFVERGYSEKKAKAIRDSKRLIEGEFTQAEDEMILKMVAEFKGGRGLWVKIGAHLNRLEQHCLYRCVSVL